jgi:hypothetical protein
VISGSKYHNHSQKFNGTGNLSCTLFRPKSERLKSIFQKPGRRPYLKISSHIKIKIELVYP